MCIIFRYPYIITQNCAWQFGTLNAWYVRNINSQNISNTVHAITKLIDKNNNQVDSSSTAHEYLNMNLHPASCSKFMQFALRFTIFLVACIYMCAPNTKYARKEEFSKK